jgi:hypothetical protein
MEASKISVSGKTYDLNFLTKKRKTNLRRKLIIEYIQDQPSGTIIRVSKFQELGQFTTQANAYAFVKRMLRDGVIMRYEGDRPKSYFYSVTGAVRSTGGKPAKSGGKYDFTEAIENLNAMGLKFTITVSNESKK